MQNQENKIRKCVIDELNALLKEYKAQNERQMQIIRKWTEDICKPDYFLTIRLPKNKETDNFEDGKESLRQIMKRFEKRLLHRPWIKHPIPFVVFAELKSTWHYHILLNSSSFTQKELENALIFSGMSDYEIDLSPIQNKYATGIYCTKQLHLDIYSMMIMDTSRIMTSYDLFNIPFKEIALEKVCFTYPEEKSPVLNNLSLKTKAGSRVAIIGNSGMGKSTLINVMQHAYEIQSGKVLYNGKNVQGISRESLRDNLTYIDQHPTFWSQKTIKENLLMFNPKATDAELYQALQSANLLDEITRKEKGIDSKVTALSAGQKQRLSLARALLRYTSLIIMDEPTANLDTQAQTKVLEGIKNLSKVKGQKPTVIFASNVPAEIASANRILLLENGQIVEDGTPKKLMTNERSKTYKRLKKYKALFMD